MVYPDGQDTAFSRVPVFSFPTPLFIAPLLPGLVFIFCEDSPYLSIYPLIKTRKKDLQTEIDMIL
jgi:hypothetical protein